MPYKAFITLHGIKIHLFDLNYFLRHFVSVRTIPTNASPAVATEASTFVDTPVFTESVLVSSFLAGIVLYSARIRMHSID